MGANTGQTVFNIVGIALSAYTGNPLFQVAFSAAGQALFPTRLDGPKLADLNTTSSSVGVGIPMVFGTPRPIAGNVIFAAKPTPVPVEESAKGGPIVSTETRHLTFAVGLAEGPIKGILRIWANGQIVYDVRTPDSDMETDGDDWASFAQRMAMSRQFAQYMTFYPGSADQLPDPTIEALLGVGLVPANRGLCYVVFNELPLADYYDQMPNLTFEVTADGTDVSIEDIYRSNDVLYPWLNDEIDPRNPLNPHEYRTFGNTWTSSLTEALESFPTYVSGVGVIGWSTSVSGDEEIMSPAFGLTPDDRSTLGLHINFPVTADVYVTTIDAANACERLAQIGAGPLFVWWTGTNTGGPSNAFEGVFTTRCIADGGSMPADLDAMGFGGAGNCDNDCAGAGTNTLIAGRADFVVHVRRVVQAPPDPCEGHPDLPESPDEYCVIGDGIRRKLEWVQVAGSYRALQEYSVVGGSDPVTIYPLNPILPVGHEDDTQAAWEAAYAAALAAGEPIEPDLVYGVDYPDAMAYEWEDTADEDTLTGETAIVGDIVKALCLRAGLIEAEIDTTELIEECLGYVVAQTASARDDITPLSFYSFFGATEAGGKIVFRLRSREPTDFALTIDDLAARESGQQRPSVMTVVRALDEDLPRLVRVHYNQAGLNTPGMQASERQLTRATNVQDLNLAITMTPSKAAKIAEVLRNEAWTGRERAQFFCDERQLSIQPIHAGSVDTGTAFMELRITDRSYSYPGLIEFNAVAHNVDDYTSDADGGEPKIYNDELLVDGPTELILIDGPALTSASDDAGLFAAVRGYFGTWTGAKVYRSDDGGTTYAEVGQTTLAATVGTLVEDVAVGPSTIFDYGTTIVVSMETGSLSSTTEAAVLNGANAAFIGGAGRWEVVQFATATPTSDGDYELTTLLRGRRGTEWAIGQAVAGDRFVLINSALLRLHLEDAAIGSAPLYKAASSGQSLTTALEVPPPDDSQAGIHPLATALEPYSVAHLEGAIDADTLTVTWQRRTRISGEWQDGVDVPLNEETEAYAYEVTDALAAVIGSDTVAVQTFTLDVTGATLPLTVTVWQLSAIVGSGYPATIEVST